jgi:phosphoribosyl 1,2-cyclic phosphodiesterase
LSNSPGLSVRFWGVRGSLSCAGPDFVRYGGNTSCLEVRAGPYLLIFDAGSGIRPFGQTLVKNGPVDADLFFSHTHLDHVVGLPFFAPLYRHDCDIRMWAGHLRPKNTLLDALGGMMTPPLFPVPPEAFGAKPDYRDFDAGETLHPRPGVTLRTHPLNHPNGATGYRIEWNNKSICYVTDCEHDGKKPDAGIVNLIRDAEIFIYDCTYTDAEFPAYRGWGHSTWQEGVRLAEAARVKKLVIFHHDPSHDDPVMEQIEREAEAMRKGTLVAREGLVLEA